MASDWDALYKALADPTRRRIIDLLYTRGPTSYTEIMESLNIDNTGKLNYHLKILGGLIQKDEQGRYTLSESGVHAAALLRSPPQSGAVDAYNVTGNKGVERHSLPRVVGGVLFIVIGAILISIAVLGAVAIPFFTFTAVGVHGGGSYSTVGVLALNPHTTRIIGNVVSLGEPEQVNVSWRASPQVNVYILNQSQFDTLTDYGRYVDVNTTPTSWVEERSGAVGSLSLNFNGQTPLYLAVSSNTTAYVESLDVEYAPVNVSQQHLHLRIPLIPVIIDILVFVFGFLLVYVGYRLLKPQT